MKHFRTLKRFHHSTHVHDALPFVILISYTLIGAAIFRSLELNLDQSERMVFKESYDHAITMISKRVGEIVEDEIVRSNVSLRDYYTREAIEWMLKYLNFSKIITERTESSPWSWYGATFYAGQLYTTIGYGLPVAKTKEGHVASMLYIMIGIPIFLIILKDVGRILSKSFRKIYKRLFTKAGLSMRALSSFIRKKETNTMQQNDAKDIEATTGEASVSNKSKRHGNHTFSIPIALLMLIIWIGVSSGLFCLWETEWSYLTSIYFFFVSISTVGLGDIVPGNKDMMIVNFLLILVGLALLSMCVNLIQTELERMLNRLIRRYMHQIEHVAAIVQGSDAHRAVQSELASGIQTSRANVEIQPYGTTSSWTQEAQNWIAGKLVDNIIAPRLKSSESESNSDSEISDVPEAGSAFRRSPALRRNPALHSSLKLKLKSLQAVRNVEESHLSGKNDFKSTVFMKFLDSDKLERYFEQSRETKTSRYIQTDPVYLKPRESPSFASISTSRFGTAFSSTENDDCNELYTSMGEEIFVPSSSLQSPFIIGVNTLSRKISDLQTLSPIPSNLRRCSSTPSVLASLEAVTYPSNLHRGCSVVDRRNLIKSHNEPNEIMIKRPRNFGMRLKAISDSQKNITNELATVEEDFNFMNILATAKCDNTSYCT